MQRLEIPLGRQLLEEWLIERHPELKGRQIAVQGTHWDFRMDALCVYLLLEDET